MLEIQNFGFNAITISAAINVATMLLGAWGLWDQIRIIWTKRSAESVSIVLNIAYLGMFTAFVIYGAWLDSGALIIQIVRAILLGIVVISLLKFRGLTWWQWLGLTAMAIGLGLMIALPYKEWFFLGFSVVGGIAAADQPYQIWKNKNPGRVSARLLMVYALGGAAWLVYGLALNKPFIAGMGLLYVVLNGTALSLFRIYKKQ